jgi:hypothetical protein
MVVRRNGKEMHVFSKWIVSDKWLKHELETTKKEIDAWPRWMKELQTEKHRRVVPRQSNIRTRKVK